MYAVVMFCIHATVEVMTACFNHCSAPHNGSTSKAPGKDSKNSQNLYPNQTYEGSVLPFSCIEIIPFLQFQPMSDA